MAQPKDQVTVFARLGAQVRIAELQQEIAAIRSMFPDLGGSPRSRRRRSSSTPIARNTAPRRRRWSAAQRRAAAARMKKYWAERRKSKE